MAAVNVSLPFFAAHNYSAAEALPWRVQIFRRPVLPQWQCESGLVLMQVAFSFQAHGDSVTASAVAQLALGHLTQADQTYSAGTGAVEIANEKELTGYMFTTQNLLGNRAAAESFYQGKRRWRFLRQPVTLRRCSHSCRQATLRWHNLQVQTGAAELQE